MTLKKLKTSCIQFLKLMLPSTKLELLIFAIYFVIFGVLGSYIAQNYFIIFDDRIPWDAYFSFDNRSIVRTGGGFERHPLANYFFEGIKNTAFYFSNGKVNFNFRFVLALFSNLVISLSIVQVFKYLKNLIQLPNSISFVLVLFFSLFSTPILLSFTPETYAYSLFFLLFFNNYAAKTLKEEKKIDGTALTFAGIFIGGLTITNIAKIYIPLLFEKKIFWNFKKIANAFIRVFVSSTVFVLLYFNRLEFDYQRIFEKTSEQYEKFTSVKQIPLWDMMVSWFYGGTMLFPSFTKLEYHNKKGFEYKALFMDVYTSDCSYLFVAIVFVMIIWAYFKNFKNNWVQILMISFVVDIIIHCVLQFGLKSGYIYGGHYIFVVPLLLGWLFHAYRKSAKLLSLFMVVLLVLTVYLGINNFIRIEEFFNFLEEFYKV